MEIIPILLKEFDEEAERTRKMLAIVPNDKYDWQPHPKSMTIKALVTHIADLNNWVGLAMTTDELDFSKTPYNPAEVNNTHELLTEFEKSYTENKPYLENTNEQELVKTWILRNGDYRIRTYTKEEAVRVALNQTVHHRAQLGVFLRLLNVPIPGSYGPSADELGL